MKWLPIAVALFWLAIAPVKTAKAQNDSIKREVADSILEKKHSPTKATIMSACLPGLGQIYNHKAWKVPIIYAGFGVLAYLIVFNTNYYMEYKCAYIESRNGDTAGNYAYLVNRYTSDQLSSAREYYRRNLEISCLVSALWYILNILDAVVDAHLYTYNINKNLSMRLEPDVIIPQSTGTMAGGVKLSIHF